MNVKKYYVMNINNIKKWFFALAVLVLAACKPEIDAPTPSKGSADFTKYIAVGNSLTAGYADGGLYLEAQRSAYPNLIAEQMKAVGGGDFTSPFFSESQFNGSGYLSLAGFNPDGTPITQNVTNNLAYRNQTATLLTKYTNEVHNLGIPGMRLNHSTSGVVSSTSGNMYFERLVPDNEAGTKNYLSFTQNRNHTFFSFWLGNNDVLGWATAGGVDAGPTSTSTLTDKSQFAQLYTLFINTLTADGQKGVVATIPDVTSVPFFNTVTVARINAGLKANPQTANLPGIYISALDAVTNIHSARLATAEDLIILTFDTDLIGTAGYGLSPLNPIENKYVLDKEEVLIAKDYVNSYNNTIRQIAASKDLAIVDAYAVLNGIKNGKDYNGIHVTSEFISGNAFSLDGIHLTPLGNAIIANEFIKAINKKYNASIPIVNVADYRGVKFP